MIDGSKILVLKITAASWANNPLLSFSSDKDEETGERVGLSSKATYQGLIFKIYFDKDTGEIYKGTFQGSLHKYWNKGVHNHDDFTFYDLQEVLKELVLKFSIILEVSVIQTLEFGVNIYTPVLASEVVNGLVAYRGYPFRFFEIKKKRDGQQIEQQQNVLKGYNKGEVGGLADNLFRFEMKALKNAYLYSRFKIETLQDLTDINKIKELADKLVVYWDDVIYYDKKINYRALTNHQQKKILYWATPRNWKDYNNKERYKQKGNFKKIIEKYGSNTHFEIGNLIAQKGKELTAEKRGQINRFDREMKQQQKGDELTKYVNGYYVTKNTQKRESLILSKNTQKKETIFRSIKPSKKVVKKRFCKHCKNDVSNKRIGVEFCSKKCNNAYHGKKRTSIRQKNKAKEIEQLNKLVKSLNKNNLWLAISYKVDEQVFTDTLHQTEISTTKEWIKAVCSVIVNRDRKNSKPIILTSYRARKLTRVINEA